MVFFSDRPRGGGSYHLLGVRRGLAEHGLPTGHFCSVRGPQRNAAGSNGGLAEQDIQISRLDSTLRALDGVTAVTSRTFVPIYLTEGLTVPTCAGFYVHREELYREGDVAEVVRLTHGIRETMEPFFGIRVTGLFRESPDSADVARLTRIVWYPSFEVWIESRDFSRIPEALRAVRARGQLQLRLEGSGVAIATDRAAR